MSKFSKPTIALPLSVRENPPHSFCFKGEEDGHSEWIKLEFLMDPDNQASGSKYSRQFAIFKDGCPEDWIKCVMAFREIENLMPMKEPADKTKM
jgi:hypothetical protein